MYSILICTLSVLAAAEFQDRVVYLQHLAPKALDRIGVFRRDNDGNLTHAQRSVLDLSENVVRNFATGEIDALQSMCDAAFGDKEKCASIFGDDSGKQQPRDLDGRAPPCECSTAADFCRPQFKHGPCEAADMNGRCGYSSSKYRVSK